MPLDLGEQTVEVKTGRKKHTMTQIIIDKESEHLIINYKTTITVDGVETSLGRKSLSIEGEGFATVSAKMTSGKSIYKELKIIIYDAIQEELNISGVVT